MAKIRKRGKTISVKFDNKRESSAFLRAVGFKCIPGAQDETEKALPDILITCSKCGKYHSIYSPCQK